MGAEAAAAPAAARGTRAGTALPARIAAFAVVFAIVAWAGLEDGGIGTILRSQLGILCWFAVAIGLLTGVLPRARPPVQARFVALAALALAGWMAMGLIWTESVERTLSEITRLVQYAGVGTLAWLSLSSRTWRYAAAGLTVGAALVVAVAICERLAPDLLSAGPVPGIGGGRLTFPAGYWNALAFIASSAIVLALAWSAYARDGLLRAGAAALVPLSSLALYLTYSRGGLIALGAGLGTLILLAPARRRLLESLGFSALGSGVVIAVAAGQTEVADGVGAEGAALVLATLLAAAIAVAVPAARPVRSSRSSRRKPSSRPSRRRREDASLLKNPAVILPMAGVLLALIVVAALDADPGGAPIAQPEAGSPVEAVSPEATEDESSLPGRLASVDSARWQLWGTGLAAVPAHPLGLGAGNFVWWWDQEGEERQRVTDAHSLYVETLAELGIVGLVALLALLGGVGAAAAAGLRGLKRSSDRGIAAAMIAVFVAFVAHAGVDWLWEVPAAALIGLGGAIVAAGAGSRPRPSPKRSRGWKTTGAIVGALALVLLQVPGLVSTDRTLAANRALAVGDVEAARELTEEALTAAPWSAAAQVQAAEAEFVAAEFDAARLAVAEAIRLEPREWRHLLLLARIELAAGELDASAEALEGVSERVPMAGPFVDGLIEAVLSGDRDALTGVGY